jgi:hypothetical protein
MDDGISVKGLKAWFEDSLVLKEWTSLESLYDSTQHCGQDF